MAPRVDFRGVRGRVAFALVVAHYHIELVWDGTNTSLKVNTGKNIYNCFVGKGEGQRNSVRNGAFWHLVPTGSTQVGGDLRALHIGRTKAQRSRLLTK